MAAEIDRNNNASGKGRVNSRRKRVRRMIFLVVLTVIGVYVGICLLVAVFQSKLVYYPSRSIDATPEAVGLEYEEVAPATSDGVKLSGWFVPAKNARAVVLFFHGNGGNLSHRLDTLKLLHDLRLSTFIFDYRGYGKSEGTPSEEGTYRDAEAAWAYLTDVRRIPADRIVFFGRSLGGAVAAHLAREHSPRALILESTFTSIPDMGAEMYPFLPVRVLSRFEYDTGDVLPKLHCPVLIVHSPEDTLVPFSHGKKLFEAANEPKRFLEISGSHNSGFLTSGKRYTDELDRFLDEVLRGGAR